jgi:hypothetical protein
MCMVPLLATAQNTSMFDPVSPPAESIRNVSILALAITGFIFVVVEGVLLYCLLRFRRGRAAGTAEPPQRESTGGPRRLGAGSTMHAVVPWEAHGFHLTDDEALRLLIDDYNARC